MDKFGGKVVDVVRLVYNQRWVGCRFFLEDSQVYDITRCKLLALGFSGDYPCLSTDFLLDTPSFSPVRWATKSNIVFGNYIKNISDNDYMCTILVTKSFDWLRMMKDMGNTPISVPYPYLVELRSILTPYKGLSTQNRDFGEITCKGIKTAPNDSGMRVLLETKSGAFVTDGWCFFSSIHPVDHMLTV